MKKLMLIAIVTLFSAVVWGYEKREVPYEWPPNYDDIPMPAYYYDATGSATQLSYPNSYAKRSLQDYQSKQGQGVANAINMGFKNEVQVKFPPMLWVELSDTLLFTRFAEYPLDQLTYGTITYLSGGDLVKKEGMWLAVYHTNNDGAGNPLQATVKFTSVDDLKSTDLVDPSPPLPTFYALMTTPDNSPAKGDLIRSADFNNKEYKLDAFTNWRRWIWQAVVVKAEARDEIFNDTVLITVTNNLP